MIGTLLAGDGSLCHAARTFTQAGAYEPQSLQKPNSALPLLLPPLIPQCEFPELAARRIIAERNDRREYNPSRAALPFSGRPKLAAADSLQEVLRTDEPNSRFI